MSKAFLIDIEKCSGCHNCQIACKDEFCSQPWLPYSESQPETGSFWCRVDEKERGQVPVVTVTYTPMLCSHCVDAPCVEVCPISAFTRRDDGLLLIDPAVCDGCGLCIEACPTRSIYMNKELSIAQKCTGCAHLLDDGWTVPRCVDVCSVDALLFGEEDKLDLEGAIVLDHLGGYGAKVYYKNLPKRFIAGCVYDPAINDVIIGAQVSLITPSEGVLMVVQSDDFGDWKFKQVEPGAYTVRVEADEYEPFTISADVTEQDRFTGDHEMFAT